MSKTEEELKQERHKKKAQKQKEKVDASIAKATEERGIVIVITGNGKGKSTSGFGTVARAVGHGYKAAVVQFIKGQWDCGERNLLEQNGVPFAVMGTGFTWETQDRTADIAAAEEVVLSAHMRHAPCLRPASVVNQLVHSVVPGGAQAACASDCVRDGVSEAGLWWLRGVLPLTSAWGPRRRPRSTRQHPES